MVFFPPLQMLIEDTHECLSTQKCVVDFLETFGKTKAKNNY